MDSSFDQNIRSELLQIIGDLYVKIHRSQFVIQQLQETLQISIQEKQLLEKELSKHKTVIPIPSLEEDISE